MRTFKLIAGFALMLTFSAVGITSASAAETLWSWLPGSGKETFTGKTEKLTWQIDADIIETCTKLSILLTFGAASSELLENAAKSALALIHIEGCKGVTGLPSHSAGDAKEIILVHAELHNCMIKAGDFGVLFKLLPVDLEDPVGLILWQGSFISRIKPLVGDKKHYEFELSTSGGLQTIEKCEGGERALLLASINGGAFQEFAFETKEPLLLFDGTIDVKGEEMMEK